VLPLVPFFLSYLAGTSIQQTNGAAATALPHRAMIVGTLAFSAGMITVFVALGASASVIGQLMREWFSVLRWVAAAAMIAMGLHFVGIIQIPLLARQARLDARHIDAASLTGAYVVGLAFAFGWTPCVGPILSLILLVAANTQSALEGTLLLAIYGLGMCLPFIITAVFAQPALRALKRLQPHLRTLERISGVILIAFGILIASGSMATIGFWMQRTFPVFQGIG
jgi:cytochrome c-type biogenesis protein